VRGSAGRGYGGRGIRDLAARHRDEAARSSGANSARHGRQDLRVASSASRCRSRCRSVSPSTAGAIRKIEVGGRPAARRADTRLYEAKAAAATARPEPAVGSASCLPGALLRRLASGAASVAIVRAATRSVGRRTFLAIDASCRARTCSYPQPRMRLWNAGSSAAKRGSSASASARGLRGARRVRPRSPRRCERVLRRDVRVRHEPASAAKRGARHVPRAARSE